MVVHRRGHCESIFTQADNWTSLAANVEESGAGFYFDPLRRFDPVASGFR